VALRDGPDESLGFYVKATGRFVKKDDSVRYSVDYGGPAVELEASQAEEIRKITRSGARLVRHVSFDEATNGRFQIRYELKGSGNVAYVKPGRPDRGFAGPNSLVELHPLNPLGNPKFHPLEPWDFGPGVKKGKLSKEVVTVDADHIELVIRQEGGISQTRRVRFWMAPSPPVITQVDDEMVLSNGKKNISHARMSNFKKCNGGMVPCQLLVVSQNAQDEFVRVTRWESTDLDSPPSDSDFVVKIGPDTTVVGMKSPPTGKDRQIDITSLKESDVVDGKASQNPGGNPG
jgi:hypothetical protein